MAFVVSYTYSYEDYLALIHARRALGMFRGVGGVLHYILAAIAFVLVAGRADRLEHDLLADLVDAAVAGDRSRRHRGVSAVLMALIDFLVRERRSTA